MCLRTWRSRSNRCRLAEDGVALQQHLAHVIERASLRVLQRVKIARVAEFREQVGDVRPNFLVAQAHFAAEVVRNLLRQKLT